MASSSSPRPTGPPRRGNCATCGKETDGEHIAGTIYDFSCEECDLEADSNWRAFIEAAVAAVYLPEE